MVIVCLHPFGKSLVLREIYLYIIQIERPTFNYIFKALKRGKAIFPSPYVVMWPMGRVPPSHCPTQCAGGAPAPGPSSSPAAAP